MIRNNRINKIPVIIILLAALCAGSYFNRGWLLTHFTLPWALDQITPGPRVQVPLQVGSHDQNQNQVPDALDMVAGARKEVQQGTRYDAAYFAGYPPEGQGACTDVIWRAFKNAGYDLKSMVDQDIKKAPDAYGATGDNPDPNIDFRRVTNLVVFFNRHARVLTNEVKPGDKDNLVNWQPGDIVVFGAPLEHIGIVSDRRLRNGKPLIIHNAGPTASEADVLLNWPSPVIYHFRYQAGG